jgi:hypothetical protein
MSIIHNYNTVISGGCQNNIDNLTTCHQQVINLGGNINKNTNIQHISNPQYPSGCSFIQDSQGIVRNITLNTYSNQNNKNNKNNKNTCGNGAKLFMGSNGTRFDKYSVFANISIDLSASIEEQVTITLDGPSDLWYGVAFDAYKMADLPYAIIVNGSGYVFEDKLGNHGPGTVLPKSITIVSMYL